MAVKKWLKKVINKAVDKIMKGKKEQKMKKKNDVITITERDSFMEGNLIEIPFIYFGRNKEKKFYQEFYRKKDNNEEEEIISVTGSPKYGLPTPYEFDVLLALMRIRAVQKPIYYGQNIINDEDIDKEDLRIEFTHNEIAKQLNKTSTGAVIKRIQLALNILSHTTITIINREILHDKGKIDAKMDAKISENGITLNIVDTYRWNTVRNKKGAPVSDKNTININAFFYRSIVNSYFKYFNYNDYLKLGKNNVAKRMFLLLSKWRNKKTKQVVTLQKIYDRLPLDKDKPVYKKNEIIKNAAIALKKSGCIESFEIKNRQLIVTYAVTVSDKKEYEKLLTRYNVFTDIQQRLTELGFTTEESGHVLNCIFLESAYGKALLRYTDYQILHNKIDNPKNYILKGLNSKTKYNIAENFYDKID